ncbi:MAG: hypothetical protein JNK53_08980, partial [Phycisphaerae bacterium]|nr:hypothetical protein [Phycisphaerae bacterium]
MSTLANTGNIPRPPRRLWTRVVIPTAIILGAAGAVVWSGWRTFAPATQVRVVQVVLKSMDSLQSEADLAAASGESDPTPVSGATPPTAPTTARLTGPSVQAPGWIEPAPFP